MTILHRDILRPEARVLFDTLAASSELAGLTLMGGTALALQIGHRVSLDFDFATFDETLPVTRINLLIYRLKQDGHQVQMITDPSLVAQFKINTGKDLLDYARDYVVDGIKVTFFAHGRTPRQKEFYRAATPIKEEGVSFGIMSVQTLMVAKTLVLGDRVRSRDLYDLMVLIRDHGYALDSFFENARSLGVIDDPEHYKAILRGEIPLDKDDEGLEPVEVIEGVSILYEYFNGLLNEYEIQKAREYFSRSATE